MAEPLMVEILAFAPTAFYHCTHCEVAWRAAGVTNRVHDEQVNESLPPDLAQDYQTVSDWVRELFRVHCDKLVVKVVDAASFEGFWKTLRYRVRRYPAIIVGREAKFAADLQQTLSASEREILRRLNAAPAATN